MRMPLAFFLAAMFIVSVDALRAVSQPVITFTRSAPAPSIWHVVRGRSLRRPAAGRDQRGAAPSRIGGRRGGARVRLGA